jgi:hypothetical protein
MEVVTGNKGVENIVCFQQHIPLENNKEQRSKALYMKRTKVIDFCEKEDSHAFTPIKIFKMCYNFNWNSTGSVVRWGLPYTITHSLMELSPS